MQQRILLIIKEKAFQFQNAVVVSESLFYVTGFSWINSKNKSVEMETKRRKHMYF